MCIIQENEIEQNLLNGGFQPVFMEVETEREINDDFRLADNLLEWMLLYGTPFFSEEELVEVKAMRDSFRTIEVA